MKLFRSLFWCAFVLSFVPSFARADESLIEWAQRRVEQGLIKPLAEREGGSRFSRGRPMAHERRVRVLQATALVDKSGRQFVSFAIDVRFGGEWQQNDITGCVYRGSGNLFVKRGDQYRSAAFLLGKKADPVAGVCEPAPAASS